MIIRWLGGLPIFDDSIENVGKNHGKIIWSDLRDIVLVNFCAVLLHNTRNCISFHWTVELKFEADGQDNNYRIYTHRFVMNIVSTRRI